MQIDWLDFYETGAGWGLFVIIGFDFVTGYSYTLWYVED